MKSNSSKLTGDTNDEPIDVDNAESDDGFEVMGEVSNAEKASPIMLREESDDEGELNGIPTADAAENGTRRRSKRRQDTRQDDSDGSLFAEDLEMRPSKRSKSGADPDLGSEEEGQDEKKKMAMETRYDGFSIYGRVLCLIIKQRNAQKGKGRPGFGGGGSAMMEDWIKSTQIPDGVEDEG